MRRLRAQFADTLVVIGVHSAKFPSEKESRHIHEAAQRHGMDWPVVNDADFEVWQSYAVRAWPTIALIDPNGKIVYTQAGEVMAEDLEVRIEAFIEQAEMQGRLNREPLAVLAAPPPPPMRPLRYPGKLFFSEKGLLFIADTGNHRLLEVRLDEDGLGGEVIRVFGSGRPSLVDGPADQAKFNHPQGMAQYQGTLYVADTGNHAIRAIDLGDHTVRTVAGTGQKAHGQFQLGPPAEVPLRSPWALWAIDDVLLIAMAGSHQIWALINEERLGIFAGTGAEALVDGAPHEAAFNQPSDLAVGLNHVLVADAEASAVRAISLMQPPRVLTLVGQGLFEFGDVDGVGTEVRLQHALGLTFHEDLVYVADSYNHKIKTLDPRTGAVKTLLGDGTAGHRDGDFATAQLFEPEGLRFHQHKLYIADTNNHCVRVADPASRQIHTFALRGLGTMPLVPTSRQQQTPTALPPLAVPPGAVEIQLALQLPPNTKPNPETDLLLEVNGGATQVFAADETPSFTVQVAEGQTIDLTLTVFYCEEANQRLCLIHRARLQVPLRIEAAATEPAVLAVAVPASRHQ